MGFHTTNKLPTPNVIGRSSNGSVTGASTFTISGLSFRPSTIIIRSRDDATPRYQTVYSTTGQQRFNRSHFGIQTSNSSFDGLADNGNLSGVATKAVTFTINADGFTVTYAGNIPSGNMDWIAYE